MTAEKTLILRFRDLVTEEGATIEEHAQILRQHGEVWWGWWMRQYECPPRALFQDLSRVIEQRGTLDAYLFNTGVSRLFSATIGRIVVAPIGTRISTPDPEKSPAYYHRGEYPAWFLLRSIEEVAFDDMLLSYDSFPTRPELHGMLGQLLGQRVASLDQLRHGDVTLWVVRREKR